MGGRLELPRRAGPGITVTVEFPGDDVSLPSGRPTPVERFGRGTVLVVEDNPVNRLLVSHQLRRLGFDTVLAADGYEALAAVERLCPDLVLMDWRMPGIDGVETARRIRSHERRLELPRTPIVAVTASAMPGDRERLIGAGMDDVLHKPVGLDVLSATLDRWTRPTADQHHASAQPVGGPTDEEGVERALAELVRDLGDRGAVVAVVQTYLDELSDSVAAIIEQEGAARSKAAHTLKSSSLVVGSGRLACLCADLESHPAAPDAAQLLAVARNTARLLSAWIEG